MNEPNTKIHFNLNEKTFETHVNIGFICDNYLKQIEKEMKLERKVLFIVMGLTALFFMIGKFEILLTYIITGIFPIKLGIDTYKYKDDNFMKMWRTYGMVFFMFFILDCWSSWVIKIFPLYFFIRTAVLMWMYLPCFKGAITVHDLIFIEGKKLLELIKDKPEDKESMLKELKAKYKTKTE